jgi:hypothetical protein
MFWIGLFFKSKVRASSCFAANIKASVGEDAIGNAVLSDQSNDRIGIDSVNQVAKNFVETMFRSRVKKRGILPGEWVRCAVLTRCGSL